VDEEVPIPGPGTRLPLIDGWIAYPNLRRLYYRDNESNAPNLRLFDAIPRPDGYFFVLPITVGRREEAGEPCQAILCRTMVDTNSSNGRPCARFAGVQRVLIRVISTSSPAEGEWLEAVDDILPPDIDERAQAIRNTFAQWLEGQQVSAEDRNLIENEPSPVHLSHLIPDTIGYLLPRPLEASIIQTASAGDRLEAMRQWMEAEIAKDPVRALFARFAQLELPHDVHAKLDRELSILKASNSASSEYDKQMTYLQSAFSLPWGSHSQPPAHSVADAWARLDSEHAGMTTAKKTIIDQLVTLLWWKRMSEQSSKPVTLKQPPLRHLLLVGPPGTGKTTFLASLGAALGRRVEIVPCGGISDQDALNGLERGYVGSRMGAIMESVARASTVDLVLGLDEIDKIGRGYRGDPYSILMEITDSARNSQFIDRHLQFPYDLSEVLIVATANTLGPIPSSLVDRFEIIELRGYSFAEKMRIARSHVLPRLYKALSVPPRLITITKPALVTIIEEYTFESGIRGLTRVLLTLMQRVLAEMLDNPAGVTITQAAVRRHLGTPMILRNPTPLQGGPGYGVVLTVFSGTGIGAVVGMQLSLTAQGSGKLYFSGVGGDGAQESAQIALSYLKLNAHRWGINTERLMSHDLHVHLDEIAYPKHGPSAGVAMTLALASAITQRRLPNKLASTGEITLDGRVLAVGGLPEKLVAAHRAGIKTVLIPAVNLPSLAEVPDDVLEQLSIIPIKTLDEALALALPADGSALAPGDGRQRARPNVSVLGPGVKARRASKSR
jgi:endopeptidase La